MDSTKAVDFSSGLKHREILLHLLERHMDELDPGYGGGDNSGCQQFSDYAQMYNAIMEEAFTFPVTCLLTGSVPENVCLPMTADSNGEIYAFKTYPEGDLMVEIDPKNLTTGTLMIHDIPGAPGFVTIEVIGDQKCISQCMEKQWEDSVLQDKEFHGDIADQIDSGDFSFAFYKDSNMTLLSAQKFVDILYIMLSLHFSCISSILISQPEDSQYQIKCDDDTRHFEITRHGPALCVVMIESFHNFCMCTIDVDYSQNDLGENDLGTINLVGLRAWSVGADSEHDDPVMRADSAEFNSLGSDTATDADSVNSVIMTHDFDVVPAIRYRIWPNVANEWITRTRLWPSKEVVHDIVSKGILLVAKQPRGGSPHSDWRLSFSEAELMLVSSRDFPCRQQAYRIFKYSVKTALSQLPVISSYHLKTILLWVSEKVPVSYWTWENLSHCYLGRHP